MADVLGYLTKFDTDNNITVHLHNPPMGIYAQTYTLPSVNYTTRLTVLADGIIHDADGTKRSAHEVTYIDHMMIIRKTNLGNLEATWNTILSAAGWAGTVSKQSSSTNFIKTARARLESAEIITPDRNIQNILQVKLRFAFITWF